MVAEKLKSTKASHLKPSFHRVLTTVSQLDYLLLFKKWPLTNALKTLGGEQTEGGWSGNSLENLMLPLPV